MMYLYTTMDLIVLSVEIILGIGMACLTGMVYQKSVDMKNRDELSKFDRKFDSFVTKLSTLIKIW